MKYSVAVKLGDAYSKEKKGYLASSRIRGHWLAKHWPECDDHFYPENFPQYAGDFFKPENQFAILKDYSVVIFNKTYEWRLAEKLKENGQAVIVDFCDPDFLLSHSSEQRVKDCLKTLRYADLAVVNGEAIKQELKKFYKGPIEIVPDRIDFEFYQPRKEVHREDLRKVVWYGYSENLRVLEPYLKDILDRGIEVMIISDKFFENFFLADCKYDPSEMITFKVWEPASYCQHIVSCDAVFIGRDTDPYLSKFKSPNRAMAGYALGMPVAYDIADLEKLKSPQARYEDAEKNYRLVREKLDISHSVKQYRDIVGKLIRRQE